MSKRQEVTILCCSYNRLHALKATLDNKLHLEGIKELIFILDGSIDGSLEFLQKESLKDQRIKVLYKEHSGPQDTKNQGLKAVKTEWVLLIDDDDLVSKDFAKNCLEVSQRNKADIVGGPWFNCVDKDTTNCIEFYFSQKTDNIYLNSPISTLPVKDVITPYLSGIFLAKKNTLLHYPYSKNYTGNAWREETDVFLTAFKNGVKIIKTPKAFSWKEENFSGGISKTKPLSYEISVVKNEYRFLRKHQETLLKLGESNWVILWTTFISKRLSSIFKGKYIKFMKYIRSNSR